MREFHPILITDVFGFMDVMVSFGVKMSKIKVTEKRVITISQKPMGGISPNLGQSCIWVRSAD